ncbi:MAG: MoaD/ThiS family protein [Microthrixaceae bacterium]
MPKVLFFAQAREAAGRSSLCVEGATVGEVIGSLRSSLGSEFAAVADASSIWCNGEPAGPDAPVGSEDELAVLPPVSGG